MTAQKLTTEQQELISKSIATHKEKILDEGHGPWVEDLTQLSNIEAHLAWMHF